MGQIQASLKNKISLRIGIHLGEIVHKGGDIFGDSVNIANRIEKISKPGGICISASIFDQLKNKNTYEFKHLGLHSFKGVGRLIDVYAINHSKLKKPNLDDYKNENIIIDYEETPSVTFFPLKNKGKKSDEFFAYCLFKDLTA